MNKKLLLAFASLFFIAFVFAQNTPAFEKRWLIKGRDTLPYRLLLPKSFDAAKSYPFVLFLHGSGERGNNNEAQLTHGSKLFLQDSIREQFPAIVVFPQCPASSYWSNVQIQYDSLSKKERLLSWKRVSPPLL